MRGTSGQTTADVRYMLLDSTYRDRYLYPEPCSYTVPFQRAMGTNIQSSVNPVTSQYPAFNFQWTTLYLVPPQTDNTYFSGKVVGGSPQQPVLDELIDQLIGLNQTSNTSYINETYTECYGFLNQIKFFYGYTTPPDEPERSAFYRIMRYDPITRTATLDRAISGFVSGTSTDYCILNDSTNFSAVDDTYLNIVLQGWQFDQIDASSLQAIFTSISPSYKNNTGRFITTTSTLYLWDMTINEIIQVTYGSGYLFNLTKGFSSSWKVTDAYMLFIDNYPSRTGFFDEMNTTAAIFSFTLDANGSIMSVDIDDPGSGYIIPPTLYATMDNDAPSRQAVITCTINDNGEVDSTEIVDGGLDYKKAFTSITPAAFVANSTIYTWKIIDGGAGFYAGDSVGVYLDCTITTGLNVNIETIARMTVSGVTNTGAIQSLHLDWPGYNYACGGEYLIKLYTRKNTTGDTRSSLVPAKIQVQQTAPYLELASTQPIYSGSYIMPVVCTAMFNTTTNPTTRTANANLQIAPTNSIPPTVPRVGQTISSTYSSEQNDNMFYGTYPILNVFPVTGMNNLYGVQVDIRDDALLERLNFSQLPLNSIFESIPYSYAIMEYKTDGVTSLDYSGSTVSSNQPVCYQMRIVSLILPNQILSTATGGLTSMYPFIFVEISNDTSPMGHNRNIIYSNNPNSLTATFSCHVSDVNSPAITNFIKIWSDGTYQVLKFKPNDNIRVRVFLPSGEDFKTNVTDYLPPVSVNPLLQISILVEMVRIG